MRLLPQAEAGAPWPTKDGLVAVSSMEVMAVWARIAASVGSQREHV
jgi:hypothetical protein